MAGAASAGAIDPRTGAQRVAAELGLALVAPATSPCDVPLPGDSESWGFGVAARFNLGATARERASLGKVEAVRRLKEGFAHTNGNLGLIAVEQETWEGDTLRFRMRALGQTAAGSIEVLDDAIRISLS
jgi:hypothetical protein